MPIKKTSNSAKFVGDYLAPDLFPELHRYRQYIDRRAYVARTMEELAEAQALYLTDVANQPKGALALSSDVINGVTISESNDNQQIPSPLPPSLSLYPVTVETMDGSPLRWKGGRESRRKYGGENIVTKHDILEDFHFESSESKETLSIQQAWQALRQLGEHCRHAPSEMSRKMNWKIRELKPDGYEVHFDPESTTEKPQKRGIKKAS